MKFRDTPIIAVIIRLLLLNVALKPIKARCNCFS